MGLVRSHEIRAVDPRTHPLTPVAYSREWAPPEPVTSASRRSMLAGPFDLQSVSQSSRVTSQQPSPDTIIPPCAGARAHKTSPTTILHKT